MSCHTIKKLQNRLAKIEDKLNNAGLSKEVLDLIDDYVEVNLELEAISNQ